MREQIQQAIDLRDAVVTCFISGDGGELGCDVDRLYDLIDAALRRAKAEGLEDALKLCVIIENHYASKRMDTRAAEIQRLAVVGVRKSIVEHLEKGGTSSAGQQCKWKYDDIDDYYETQCDEGYCCNGTLVEHKIKFCPFCGGAIQLDARAAQIEDEATK